MCASAFITVAMPVMLPQAAMALHPYRQKTPPSTTAYHAYAQGMYAPLRMCASTETNRDQAAADAAVPFSRSSRALAVTLALSTGWTFVQLAGALVSKSSSLLSDALAMVVDDGAYALNLAAELRPGQERAIKLVAPLISATILLCVTAVSFNDAISTLQGGEAEAGEVDGAIVLGFGAAMLVVDALMLRAILFRADATRSGPDADAFGAGAADAITLAQVGAAWCEVSPRTELNLFSGLSHVMADALRSLTQVVVGAAILAGGPSEAIDAYGTLVISGIILLGACFLLYEVALQGREWLSDQRGDSL